jgi:hypothetical protein
MSPVTYKLTQNAGAPDNMSPDFNEDSDEDFADSQASANCRISTYFYVQHVEYARYI